MGKPPISFYWTPEKLLSYNRFFNIAIGSRGCGKSFAGKKWCISDFKKSKKQFIYLRRTEEDIRRTKDSFFRDIRKEGYFSDDEFAIDGNLFLINKDVAGYAMSLSLSGNVKSNSMPEVNKILYDEFLIDTRKTRVGYLRDETGLLVNLFETIDRGKDETRVLMLSNSSSVVNPYFQKWGIKIPKGAKFVKTGKEIVTEIVHNEDFQQWKSQTRFGQFLNGTDEGRSIIGNEFTADNYAFVEKLSGHKNYLFTMQYEGTSVGVWYVKPGIYYCSSETQYCVWNFAFSTLDHGVNSIMFKNARQNRLVKNLLEAHDFGNVRYENIQIKGVVMELFDYI